MMAASNLKTCPICGRQFPCPPSDKTVTCSPACSRIHRSRMHKGKRNVWPEESKARVRLNGRSVNLLLGTAAAQASPRSGAYVTNVSARHWILKAPDGMTYEFDNLNEFIRRHPEWFVNPRSARSALTAVATGKRNVGQYKGWQVLYRSKMINKYRSDDDNDR